MTTFIRCDNCGKQAPDTRDRYTDNLGSPEYKFVVLYIEANEDSDHGHFCSWSCLATVATERAMSRELDTRDWSLDALPTGEGTG